MKLKKEYFSSADKIFEVLKQYAEEVWNDNLRLLNVFLLYPIMYQVFC
jgi:hypothetical protein